MPETIITITLKDDGSADINAKQGNAGVARVSPEGGIKTALNCAFGAYNKLTNVGAALEALTLPDPPKETPKSAATAKSEPKKKAVKRKAKAAQPEEDEVKDMSEETESEGDDE